MVDTASTTWTKEAIRSLRPSDWVFAISQATKNDLCNYRKDLDQDKVIVTPLAASAEKFYVCNDTDLITKTRQKYGLPDDAQYILGLSTIAPHKNFDSLVRCFGRVIQQDNIKNTYLVLVGTRGWNAEQLIAAANNESSLAKQVIFTGRVSDEDLSPLYLAHWHLPICRTMKDLVCHPWRLCSAVCQ
jgi:glycosyltransferase involved in cell wall biosynthesis